MFFSQIKNPISVTRNDYLDEIMRNLNDTLMNFSSFIAREVTASLGKRINTKTSPYNSDNILMQEYEPIIIMVGDEIERLTRNSARVICKLNEIGQLEENWNEHGAQPFDGNLISLCKKIVADMPVVPEVFPTACNSIQFEFTNDKEDYLEFEIFPDHTEIYIEQQNQEQEKSFQHENNFIQILRQVVVDFYG